MDDTITNREKILYDLIVNSLKETSLEYVKELVTTLVDKIKLEFTGKTFQVSQQIVGKNSMQTSYENQLQSFGTIKNLVDTVCEKAIAEQEEFEKKMQKYNIQSESMIVSDKAKNELRAAVTEIILEGLCWVEPKILDKKEAGYVAV